MISSFYAWSFAVLNALAWVVYFVWLVRSRRRRYVEPVDWDALNAIRKADGRTPHPATPKRHRPRDGVW